MIQPSTGWSKLNVAQIWAYRDLLLALSSRDVKLRYRQTALGAIWVVLQPLLGAGVLSFVFTKIGNINTPNGVPPFMIAYAGFLLWNVFSSAVSKGSSVIVGNSGLISKVYFPRLILPLSVVLPILLDMLVALVVLVILMINYHLVPNLALLLWPVFLLITLTMALGVSLITSSLMVSYRDVSQMVPVILNLLLYAAPVAYSAYANFDRVPLAVQGIYKLNPLVSLLEGSRYALFGVGSLDWWGLLYSAAFALVAFVVGLRFFYSMERKFADVI